MSGIADLLAASGLPIETAAAASLLSDGTRAVYVHAGQFVVADVTATPMNE